MNPKEEDAVHVANRFSWTTRDNDIWIVNHEGIERIMRINFSEKDVKKQFMEMNFNKIPLYDKEYCKLHHVNLDRTGLDINDVLGR